jgi:type IV pilus assembly protein PilM
MAFRLFSFQRKIANIVVKDHVIRYVELKQRHPLVVHKCGERWLPEGVVREGKIVDEERFMLIMEECVAEWKLKNRRIRFLVPDPFIVIRKISLPADLQQDEIRGYLFMELGSSIHLPFEEAVFDFIVLERKKEKLDVLLFAAPESIVMKYAELFEQVKLKPIVADISPLSLYRLFYEYGQADENDHLLFVQFDLSSLNVSVFHQHTPIFTRQLAFDSHFADWERTEAGWKWTKQTEQPEWQLEDIYKEMERFMNFYRFSLHQGNEQITRIVMTGDHPLLSTLSDMLRERLDVPVEEMTVSTEGQKVERSYYLALGLALKEGTAHASRN